LQEGLQPTCPMYNLGIEAAVGAASNGLCSLEDGMKLLYDMRSHQIDGVSLASALSRLLSLSRARARSLSLSLSLPGSVSFTFVRTCG
jgi:hypothetical protein